MLRFNSALWNHCVSIVLKCSLILNFIFIWYPSPAFVSWCVHPFNGNTKWIIISFNMYLLFTLIGEFTTILWWVQILKLSLHLGTKMLFDWVKPIYSLRSKALKLPFPNTFTKDDKGSKRCMPLLFYKEACFSSSLLI